MSSSKLVVQGAAGALGGGPLNVEDVFSTYLWTGDGTSGRNIVNGIDLSNEGGAVWTKKRSGTGAPHLFNTISGVNKYLLTSSSAVEDTFTSLTSFNDNGFTVASYSQLNNSSDTYASWTFRKAPKFFDVVTYDGNSTAGRTVSHNLGSVPGCIIVKSTTNVYNWTVYHRGIAADAETDYLRLNSTGSALDLATAWNDTAPTSTEFTLGSHGMVNGTGESYVAYLFAHNDGDGEFGPDGDADIIKCGSYTGNSSNDGPEINLGFEPQFLIIKAAERTANWFVWDTMRGLTVADIANSPLYANLNNAEYTGTTYVEPTPTGFKITDNDNNVNSSLSGYNQYIYIAIRRDPMAVPEDADDVFDVGDASETGSTAPEYEGGFTVDMALKRIQSASQSNYIFDRLRSGQSLITNGSTAESAFGAAKFDYMDGYYNGTSTSSSNWSAMWKRAPNFFDVVAYTGNGTAGRTVSHNLGVAPEMIWVKRRDGDRDWVVYHTGLDNTVPEQYGIYLNANLSRFDQAGYWNDTAPTSTVFTVGTSAQSNESGSDFIAYLFASLDGVSKVGSYTGSASAQTIDCGFTSGAKFVLIKRTDSAGSWAVWDTNRGIVAGNDPYFQLQTNSAPATSNDYIDPHNSGFTIAGGVGFVNTSGGSYIFYAVA